MKVPFDDLTSLISTWSEIRMSMLEGPQVEPKHVTLPSSDHTSACIRLRTLLSKYPFVPLGTVLALVCRPILITVPGGCNEICLGTKVSLRGIRCKAGKAGLGVEAAGALSFVYGDMLQIVRVDEERLEIDEWRGWVIRGTAQGTAQGTARDQMYGLLRARHCVRFTTLAGK